MATLRKRSNGHWQARVRKTNQSISKTFINKVDAERWAKQIEVEIQKGSVIFTLLFMFGCGIFDANWLVKKS